MTIYFKIYLIQFGRINSSMTYLFHLGRSQWKRYVINFLWTVVFGPCHFGESVISRPWLVACFLELSLHCLQISISWTYSLQKLHPSISKGFMEFLSFHTSTCLVCSLVECYILLYLVFHPCSIYLSAWTSSAGN